MNIQPTAPRDGIDVCVTSKTQHGSIVLISGTADGTYWEAEIDGEELTFSADTYGDDIWFERIEEAVREALAK